MCIKCLHFTGNNKFFYIIIINERTKISLKAILYYFNIKISLLSLK